MCHHKAPHDFWEYAQRYEHMFDDKTIPEPESLFEDRSHRSPATRDFGSSVTPRSRIRSYIMISVKRIMLQVRYREQST